MSAHLSRLLRELGTLLLSPRKIVNGVKKDHSVPMALERLEDRLAPAGGAFTPHRDAYVLGQDTPDPAAPVTKWAQPGGLGSPITITYSYSNLLDGGMQGLTAAQLRSAVQEDLSRWAAVAPLNFVEVPDSGPAPSLTDYNGTNAPMIRFGHISIDGPYNTLGYGYYPGPTSDGISGDVFFDDTEHWTLNAAQGLDFLEVCEHEIGHALGMAHEPAPPQGLPAIMNPVYGGRFHGLGTSFLYPDDIAGIRALYGTGVGSVEPLGSPPVAATRPDLWHCVHQADVNGDGKADVIGMDSTGTWWAGISGGSGVNVTSTLVKLGVWSPTVLWQNVQVADVNGDGKADVIGMTSNGIWWAGIATGSGTNIHFVNVPLGTWYSGAGWKCVRVGDVNGDGKADVVAMTSTGVWWAGLATGSGTRVTFTDVPLGQWNPAAGWQNVQVADVNGDGKMDVIGQTSGGAWYAGLIQGSGTNLSFSNVLLGQWNPTAGWQGVEVADVNGDGRADVVGMTSGGAWYAGIVTGSGNNLRFSNVLMNQWNPGAGWQDLQVADVNGDGRMDVIGMTSGGGWWAGIASGSGTKVWFTNVSLGLWSPGAGWQDVQAADVNGDGMADVIGRTASGAWWVGVATLGGFGNVSFSNRQLETWPVGN